MRHASGCPLHFDSKNPLPDYAFGRGFFVVYTSEPPDKRSAVSHFPVRRRLIGYFNP